MLTKIKKKPNKSKRMIIFIKRDVLKFSKINIDEIPTVIASLMT